MKKHTFYIGLNDKDTKTQLFGTLDAYRIVTNILGVDSTIKECKGVYTHEDGTITAENIRVEFYEEMAKIKNYFANLKANGFMELARVAQFSNGETLYKEVK